MRVGRRVRQFGQPACRSFERFVGQQRVRGQTERARHQLVRACGRRHGSAPNRSCGLPIWFHASSDPEKSSCMKRLDASTSQPYASCRSSASACSASDVASAQRCSANRTPASSRSGPGRTSDTAHGRRRRVSSALSSPRCCTFATASASRRSHCTDSLLPVGFGYRSCDCASAAGSTPLGSRAESTAPRNSVAFHLRTRSAFASRRDGPTAGSWIVTWPSSDAGDDHVVITVAADLREE